jgi:excisionase family DNA binding protein
MEEKIDRLINIAEEIRSLIKGEDEYVDISTACKLMKVSRPTIKKRIDNGLITAINVNGSTKCPRYKILKKSLYEK